MTAGTVSTKVRVTSEVARMGRLPWDLWELR